MYAPVLNPLTASLAPRGHGRHARSGCSRAIQTTFSAVGPLLAGVALNAGHGTVFVAAHVVISLVAVGAAWRLRSLLAGTPAGAPETVLAADGAPEPGRGVADQAPVAA